MTPKTNENVAELGITLVEDFEQENDLLDLVESSDDPLKKQVQKLYRIANKPIEKINKEELFQFYQESVALLKFLRKSQGTLKTWNKKQREERKKLLKEINLANDENIQLQKDLERSQEELNHLMQEKIKIVAQRDKVLREIKNIEIEANVAAKTLQKEKSLFRKFSILWSFLKGNLLSDDIRDYGVIDNSIEPEPDKPQMGTDTASVGRYLLDK